MTILGIDTSARACSAALMQNGKLVNEEYLDRGLTHSAQLMPLVDACLQRAGVKIADVDLFAVANGPGSFTGLRIGVAAVKAFAQFTGKPIAAVSTMDALAAGCAQQYGWVCPIMDARNRRVYTAFYHDGQKLGPDDILPIEAVFERLNGKDPVLFIGDAAVLYRGAIQDALPGAAIAPQHLLQQRAGAVCSLAEKAYEKGALCTAQTLAPCYLRESQAERMKRQKKNE